MVVMLVAVTLILQTLQRPDCVVVAHRDVRVTMSDVRDVYVGEKEFSDHTRLIPVDNTSVQHTFIELVLMLNPRQYETLWIKKAFRNALTPPNSIATDADVIAFVARTPGAIGYVRSVPAGAGVTVIDRD